MDFEKLLSTLLGFEVINPACASGNMLYVANKFYHHKSGLDVVLIQRLVQSNEKWNKDNDLARIQLIPPSYR